GQVVWVGVALVGETGGPGWGPVEPRAGSVVGSEPAEAVVRPAAGVGGADQPPAGGAGGLGAGDGPPSSRAWREVGAERRVEPLAGGRGADGGGRRRRHHRLDAGQRAVADPARDPDDVPLG